VKRGRPASSPTWGKLDFRRFYSEVLKLRNSHGDISGFILGFSEALVSNTRGICSLADEILEESEKFLANTRERQDRKKAKKQSKRGKSGWKNSHRDNSVISRDSNGIPVNDPVPGRGNVEEYHTQAVPA
jgi:hypothetical protein